MKSKLILLLFLLFSKPMFASMDALIFAYIPISTEMTDVKNRDGIMLYKALFSTYYAQPESLIDAVTWEYKVNTPHKAQKDVVSQSYDVNLAHIKGLKVSLDENEKGCSITIDSRNIDMGDNDSKYIDKLLKYVEKATRLNMKEAKLNCEIKQLKAPEKKVVLPMPKALDLVKNSLNTFRGLELQGYPKYPFVSDTLYPLGYSKDGKFAYVLEHNREPSDMVEIEVYVQDLISDKILWKNSFSVDGSVTHANFKSFWRERNELIASKLDLYHITPMENIKLDTTSIQYGDNLFEIYSTEKKSYVKDWDMKFLTHSSIIVDSKSLGKKIVDQKSYKTNSQVLARKPMATINFDNGKRRAIVVGKVTRGWEGPPHNLYFEIVGVNLDVGFGK